MRDETREVRRLKKLLLTERLSDAERQALEQRVKELEAPPSEVPPRSSMPGVLGVFDRPLPVASHTDKEETVPVTDAAKAAVADESAEPSTPEPAEADLSPEEVDELADKIAAIADRVVWLRSVWARTLSVEIDREAEVWLVRLKALAKRLPEEVLEAVLGKSIGLLRRTVRNVDKPVISEKVQQRVLPPSAPSLDAVGTWSELYYAFRNPRPPRDPPRGYVPDGLQALVS